MRKIYLPLFFVLFTMHNVVSQNAYYDAIRLKEIGNPELEGKKVLIKSTPENQPELMEIYVRYFPQIDSLYEKYLNFRNENKDKLDEALVKSQLEERENQILNGFRNIDNPFIVNASQLQSTRIKEIENIIRKTASSISGLNVTTLADGMAKFLVERTKKELSITFFERFKDALIEQKELQILFPSTFNNLSVIDSEIYMFSAYLDLLREGFQKDLVNVLTNFSNLVDNPENTKLEPVFKDFPQLQIIISDALFFSESFRNGEHIGQILDNYAELTSKEKLAKIDPSLFPSLQLLNIISQSLRSTDEESYWVSWKQVNDTFKDDITLRIYMGLLFQQIRNFEKNNSYEFKFGDYELLKKLRDAANDNIKLKELYAGLITETIKKGQQVTFAFNKLQSIQNNSDPKVGYEDLYNLMNASLNFVEHSIRINEFMSERKANFSFDKMLNSMRSAASIYVDINQKNYVSAIFETSSLLSSNTSDFYKKRLGFYNETQNLIDNIEERKIDSLKNEIYKTYNSYSFYFPTTPSFIQNISSYNTKESVNSEFKKYSKELVNKETDILETLQKIERYILKYGNFIGTVAKAETSDDVKAAIEAVALPAGSASIKRRTAKNIAVNAYVGLASGVSYNFTTENLGGDFAINAPIGIAFTSGGDKPDKAGNLVKKSSHSFFISAVDIGALTAFRFGDSDTEQIPNINLGNIISPGAFYIVGFKNSPISWGIGAQISPQLQNVKPDVAEIDNNINLMIRSFIAIDIPILNLYTKSK